MSAKDYYGAGQPQQQYYPPQGQGGYYPQQPQQAYQQGQYGGQPGYGGQPAYQQQPVYVQGQPADKGGGGNSGCMACLAGMCLCCCAEELCECLF